jgi:pyruvate-formate lyase-activating enzyme
VSTTLLLADEPLTSSFVDGPGNRFVVFLQGCTFDCVACHNPQTIARRPGGGSREVSVAELVERIRRVAAFVSGVTVSGGECTVQADGLVELCATLRGDRALRALGVLLDSNGDAPVGTWERLAPVVDGVMLDLKALDPAVHRTLTGSGNEQVLTSLAWLAAHGKLAEVRLLLVPGVNDTDEQLRATAAHLLAVAPGVPVRVIGFRHHGTRAAARAWPESTPADRDRAVAVLTAAGLAGVSST